MSGSREGAARGAAARLGIGLDVYQGKIAAGEKWCRACKAWHSRDQFGRDASRSDGLAATCSKGRNAEGRNRYEPHPLVGRPGPKPTSSRDDDRSQARHKVNLEVRMGRLPPANALPCVDCGHVWKEGEKRHEYDHARGYGPDHHLDVEPVCSTCHHRRDATKEVCIRGHVLTVSAKPDGKGGRTCVECRRAREKETRTAEWWRRRRARKKNEAET